jgi:hypothetical protein
MPGSRKLREGDFDLPRDRSDRNAFVGRILPQIAEQASERAFPIRQKNRCHVFDPAHGAGFRFHQKRIRNERINGAFRTSRIQNAMIVTDPCSRHVVHSRGESGFGQAGRSICFGWFDKYANYSYREKLIYRNVLRAK